MSEDDVLDEGQLAVKRIATIQHAQDTVIAEDISDYQRTLAQIVDLLSFQSIDNDGDGLRLVHRVRVDSRITLNDTFSQWSEINFYVGFTAHRRSSHQRDSSMNGTKTSRSDNPPCWSVG